MSLAEIRDRVVIRMLVSRQIAERHVLVGRPLDPPRTRHPSRVAINQHPHHHPRIIGRQPAPVSRLVGRIHRRQIQRLHHVRYKPRQMALGQPILQRRRQQIGLIEIAVPKLFAHRPKLH